MPTTYYMHTVNGSPAYFNGEQIVYWPNRLSRKHRPSMATSLAQIRDEQRRSSEQRKAWGFDPIISSYSYIRIVL